MPTPNPGRDALERILLKDRSADLPALKEAWPEVGKVADTFAKAQDKALAEVEKKQVKLKTNSVLEMATKTRGANWQSTTTIDDDWKRLAVILNDETHGFRGTQLVWRGTFFPLAMEIAKAIGEFTADAGVDKALKSIAQAIRGKDQTTLIQDLEKEEIDKDKLETDVKGAFLEGNTASAAELGLDFLEYVPGIALVCAVMKMLKTSFAMIKQVYSQFVNSRFRANTVSVIEFEALSGAYTLGTRELKALSAKLLQHVSTALAATVGFESLVSLGGKACEMFVKVFLATKREIDRRKVNIWLNTADWTSPDARQILRENPILPLYLPFLSSSTAACILGLVDPGVFADQISQDVKDRAFDEKLGEANPADIDGMVRHDKSAGSADIVLVNDEEMARRKAQITAIVVSAKAGGEVDSKGKILRHSERWLFSMWSGKNLVENNKEAPTGYFKDVFDRYRIFLRQIEKPLTDHEFKLVRPKSLPADSVDVYTIHEQSFKYYAWEKILRFGLMQPGGG